MILEVPVFQISEHGAISDRLWVLCISASTLGEVWRGCCSSGKCF